MRILLTLDWTLEESIAQAPLKGKAVAPIAIPNAPKPPLRRTSLLGSSILVFSRLSAILFLPVNEVNLTKLNHAYKWLALLHGATYASNHLVKFISDNDITISNNKTAKFIAVLKVSADL